MLLWCTWDLGIKHRRIKFNQAYWNLYIDVLLLGTFVKLQVKYGTSEIGHSHLLEQFWEWKHAICQQIVRIINVEEKHPNRSGTRGRNWTHCEALNKDFHKSWRVSSAVRDFTYAFRYFVRWWQNKGSYWDCWTVYRVTQVNESTKAIGWSYYWRRACKCTV